MKSATHAASLAGPQRVGSAALKRLFSDKNKNRILQTPEEPEQLRRFLEELVALKASGWCLKGIECTNPAVASLIDKDMVFDGQHIVPGMPRPTGESAIHLARKHSIAQQNNKPPGKVVYVLDKMELDALCAAAILILSEGLGNSFLSDPDFLARFTMVDELDRMAIPIKQGRPCQATIERLARYGYRCSTIIAALHNEGFGPTKRVRKVAAWLLGGDESLPMRVTEPNPDRVQADSSQIKVISFPVRNHHQVYAVDLFIGPPGQRVGRFQMWKRSSVVHVQEIRKLEDGPFRFVVRKLPDVDLDMVALCEHLTNVTGQQWTGSVSQLLSPSGIQPSVDSEELVRLVVQFIESSAHRRRWFTKLSPGVLSRLRCA